MYISVVNEIEESDNEDIPDLVSVQSDDEAAEDELVEPLIGYVVFDPPRYGDEVKGQ